MCPGRPEVSAVFRLCLGYPCGVRKLRGGGCKVEETELQRGGIKSSNILNIATVTSLFAKHFQCMASAGTCSVFVPKLASITCR